jgi:hypothetical protein
VLTATSHSKSLLRAVASELVQAQAEGGLFSVLRDHHPSGLSGPLLRAEPAVGPAEGVDHVMAQFFRDQAAAFGGDESLPPEAPSRSAPAPEAGCQPEPELTEAEELRCEEEILAAFAPDQRHG